MTEWKASSLERKYLQPLIDQYWKIYNGLPNDKKNQMDILWKYLKGYVDEIIYSNEELENVKKELSSIQINQIKLEEKQEIAGCKFAESFSNEFNEKMQNITKAVFTHPRWTGFFLLIFGRYEIEFANKFRVNNEATE